MISQATDADTERNGAHKPGRRPRVAVLYHYFHPDDVVSARHFAEFCTGLAARGWEVTALPCNRGCRDESRSFPTREAWAGIDIRRIWRPRFRQASGIGRILNAVWMMAAWCVALLRNRGTMPDVLVIGTDPVLSILVAIPIRKLLPRIRIVHWCFDLYPEGPIAEGMLREDSLLVKALRPMLRKAYASCDLVADLGSCMRRRLDTYGHNCRKATLVPWALAEPADVEPPAPEARRDLFGDSPLGLLYSGNFGRAHSFEDLLDLARSLRGSGAHFCFGVRGNRVAELRAAVKPEDSNVSFAGFAPEAVLAQRLAAADIHLVSLRPEWTGMVVPSKFFGALAAGRPVLFAGSRESAIARWIKEFKVGWVLESSSCQEVITALLELSRCRPAMLELQRHCHGVYHRYFSQLRVMDEWNHHLTRLVGFSRTLPLSMPSM